jgi:hypothetical protein
MILHAIGKSLPMSVGVALSPLPVAAIIIMLMTARARANAPAFLLGWILGILTVGLVVFLIPGSQTGQGETTASAGLIRILLGVALLGLAGRRWWRRPAPDEPMEVPTFLTSLDNINMLQASLTGFFLSGVNPKNLILVAAGAAAIDTVLPTMGTQVVAFALFAAIGSLSVATPVAGFWLVRHKAKPILDRWKDWLIRNNAAVVSRTNSLVFRIRFVFPVGHWFPVVVSQYSIHVQSSSPPRRSGRAPLTHPAPSHHLSPHPLTRLIAIRSVKRFGDANGYAASKALNLDQFR